MRYQFQNGERVYEIAIERSGETLTATVDGQSFAVEVLDDQPGILTLKLDDRPVTLYWAVEGGVKWVSQGGCTYRLERPQPRRAKAGAAGAGAEEIRAPMPAQVREVLVSEGDAVEKGQTLLLLEAMKMEIRVKTSTSGQVKRLLVKQGQAVDKEQLLAEVKDEKAEGT